MSSEDRKVRAEARRWWNSIGRALVRREANIEIQRRVGPGIIVRGREKVLPSGILAGAPWDELTPGEQEKVVAAWRANFGPTLTGRGQSTTG